MSLRLYMALERIYGIGWLILVVSYGLLWERVPAPYMFLIASGLGLLAIGLARLVLPIRCIAEGCAGRMRRTEDRVCCGQVRATYCCEDCGSLQEELIFSPDFDFDWTDYS